MNDFSAGSFKFAAHVDSAEGDATSLSDARKAHTKLHELETAYFDFLDRVVAKTNRPIQDIRKELCRTASAVLSLDLSPMQTWPTTPDDRPAAAVHTFVIPVQRMQAVQDAVERVCRQASGQPVSRRGLDGRWLLHLIYKVASGIAGRSGAAVIRMEVAPSNGLRIVVDRTYYRDGSPALVLPEPNSGYPTFAQRADKSVTPAVFFEMIWGRYRDAKVLYRNDLRIRDRYLLQQLYLFCKDSGLDIDACVPPKAERTERWAGGYAPTAADASRSWASLQQRRRRAGRQATRRAKKPAA